MEIFLIRHTTPLVAKGICYGQTDLDVTESFLEEAAIIKQCLLSSIHYAYCSPLQRCKKLAEYLFHPSFITTDPDLMELNCGVWEMQRWDDIPRTEIDPWMNDFVNVSCPGGESYVDLHKRVVSSFEKIAEYKTPVAIVAHGGVLRSHSIPHYTNALG
jgi:alpha-ribazole phosphatase